MAVNIKEILINDKPAYVMTTDKAKAQWTARKSHDGFAFYVIEVSKGTLPTELSGRFSRSKDAIEAFMIYEARMPKAESVKREEIREARAKQKEEVNA